MPRITGVHHASLLVRDTEISLNFYRDLLGLSVDSKRPDLGYPGAWLQAGNQQIHLLELPNPDPLEGRPEHGGRDRHIALAVPDLGQIIERLTRAGVHYSVSRSGRKALFCRDPDSNALEFVEQD
jgi:glyoxylase I family protein